MPDIDVTDGSGEEKLCSIQRRVEQIETSNRDTAALKDEGAPL